MRVVVSPAIQADHETLRGLVIGAFEGVEAGGVEIHLDRAQPRKPVYVGRAYPQLPSRPRTASGTKYLVRLVLPSVLRNRGYPVTYRYRGLSTAPWITVHDWRERVVALAAHEAFHIHQFREGLRRSEVQAERWALRMLTNWRAASVHVIDVRTPEVRSEPTGEDNGTFRARQLTLFGAA